MRGAKIAVEAFASNRYKGQLKRKPAKIDLYTRLVLKWSERGPRPTGSRRN